MALKNPSLVAADVNAANARGQALLAGTPTAVTGRYDRRVGRVVIALSTGLEIGFKPHDAQGLEPHGQRNWQTLRYRHRVWACTSRNWMLTCTCRRCSKGFLDHASGWHRLWVKWVEGL